MSTLSRSGRGCLDMAPGPPSGLEIAFQGLSRNLYISAIAVYSTWQKSKSILFPPTSQAFASLLLIHRFNKSRREALGLTRPECHGLKAIHRDKSAQQDLIALGYVIMPEFRLAVIGRKALKIAQSSLGRVNADPQRPPKKSQSHLGDWPDPAQDLDFLLRVRR